MSYTFYSFRNRTDQDELQWENQTFDGLVKSSQNRTLMDIFGRYLQQPKMKIIEAGCGMGTWIYNLKQMGHDVIGVDYMQSTVDKVKEYDPDFPMEVGDVHQLHFPDNTFDAYVSLGVIEHFQEGPQKALLEAKRILKPNGLAFITVPYLNMFRRLVTHNLRDIYFAGRRLMKKKYYFWEYRYTKSELKQFLSEAKFEVIYTGIDDYKTTDNDHHIGLCADFFFLRSRKGEIWELNKPAKVLLKLGKLFSPWLFCSGLHIVARNMK